MVGVVRADDRGVVGGPTRIARQDVVGTRLLDPADESGVNTANDAESSARPMTHDAPESILVLSRHGRKAAISEP